MARPVVLRPWQAQARDVVLSALRHPTQHSPLVYAATGTGKSILVRAILADVLTTLRPGWGVCVMVPTQALVGQLRDTLAAGLPAEAVGVYYGRSKKPSTVTIVCRKSLAAYVEHQQAAGIRCALLVCDEAHRAEAVADVIEALAPARRFGVTATPYLADDGLTLWTHVAVQYRLTQAIEAGDLCPLRVVRGWGDSPADSAARTIDIARTHGRGLIVDAHDIADAEQVAEMLRDHDVPALAVHSKLPASAVKRAVADHKAGTLRALVQVDLLSEGVDMPWVDGVVLRRRMGSSVRLVQLVGRVLRTADGKSHATAYDLLGQLPPAGLDLDAVLGRMEQDADREARCMTAAERQEQDLEAAYPLARARDELADWTLGALDTLRSMGLSSAPPDVDGPGFADPMAPALPYQVRRLGTLDTRWLADDLRATIGPMLERPERLTVREAAMVDEVVTAARAEAARRYRAAGSWRDVRWRLSLDGAPVDAARRVAGKG